MFLPTLAAAFFLTVPAAVPSVRADEGLPEVTAPPESFFEKVRERDRDAARTFYKKYLDVKGLSVVASAEVADEALQRTHHLVTHLLAGRPDILQAMIKNSTRLIIGKDIDPGWRERLVQTYKNATAKGLWKNAFTGSNPAEYWAEICQSYFDCNRINNWNHAAIGTRKACSGT
jgi:hypothetical protein